MNIRLTILIFTLTCLFTSCGQKKTETNLYESANNIFKLDTSVIAILPPGQNQYWIFKDGKPIDLTNDDLLKVESILKKCISDYNPEQEKHFKEVNDKHPEYKLNKKDFIIDLTRYKRQYLSTINSKGEKEVWINCFCGALIQNWKTNIIMVEDGGNCYFSLKINLTTEKYFDLMINGVA